MSFRDFEDTQIIGTDRYEAFQRMVSRAGEFAVYETYKAGLPVTGIDEQRRIVKTWPDGRKEILGQLPPAFTPEKTEYDMSELPIKRKSEKEE
ncbi:MAG: hypothetical protein LBM77_05000 [Spirochaetaceae bacterium]|jgi:hypothetical protein|nr:hypothetical protein [Spirochaetaceae bacterium]